MKRSLWIFAAILGLAVFWPSQREELKPVASTAKRQPASNGPGKAPLAKLPAERTSVAPGSEQEKALVRIGETQKCYASESCDFSQADPRSYEFAVGLSLAGQLRDFKKRFPKSGAVLSTLGRTYILSLDPTVQSAALELLVQEPMSGENLQALRQGIEATSDPSLVAEALPELKRYLGTPFEPEVHATLAQILSSGAHFSSQVIADGILPFINSLSLQRYRQAALGLSKTSTTGQRLRSAIKEFELQQSGG